MKRIFRWVMPENNIVEYRFTDGICDGCFKDDKLLYKEYKGRPITEHWIRNLGEMGFKEVHNPL